MNLNTVTVAGRLTRDPDLKQVGRKGTSMARIGLAVNRRVKRGEEWVDEPTFVNVILWGARAEAFCKHHAKGDPACFPNAELAYNSWEDKQTGDKRSELYLEAKGFEFVPKRDRQPSGGSFVEDDEVPF